MHLFSAEKLKELAHLESVSISGIQNGISISAEADVFILFFWQVTYRRWICFVCEEWKKILKFQMSLAKYFCL